MNIELIASTNGMTDVREMIEFGLRCARICYTAKGWSELQKEPINEDLLQRLITSGHHSVFEHVNLTFNFDGMPKALAMFFNNEQDYATSEKSARYTVMTGMEPAQRELYQKWMQILIPEIDKVFPGKGDSSKREEAIRKIAQENARYMTSVFTPTKLVHTISLRQLNFIQKEFERFLGEFYKGDDKFKTELSVWMSGFLGQTEDWAVPGLDNQTDRHLSFFAEDLDPIRDNLGDQYARTYLLSFAGLAQAHRHRTIRYNVLSGTELGAPNGFFVPPIVEAAELDFEWVSDLESVAQTDFPQAQLLEVYERGLIEDFRSKAFLRMCGHAQLETMMSTLATAREYSTFQKRYGPDSLKPKCQQGYNCPSNCVWGGKKALERLV